jgi:hypothetical protein
MSDDITTDDTDVDAEEDAAAAGYVAGLIEERRGYVLRDLPDRIAQVDSELARFGAAVETAEDKPKRGRGAKPSGVETTEG